VTLLGFPEDFEKEAMAHLVARLRAATKACALLVTERGGAQDENRGVSARCATRAPRSSANKEKR
ncbi:MAG: hypothetical protein U1E27_14235, partial [Kiritimatiellia bacterium]|nr:hypothetical protein [Kiritimatiellia bacterium]